MAGVHNIDGLTVPQIQDMVRQGGKFVHYKYCISILVMTFNRGSDIYFIRPAESGVVKGLPYTFLSLILGWWGIPWGPIYTIGALYTNLSGGKDITDEMMAQLGTNQPAPTANAGGGYNIPGSGSGNANPGGYNIPGSGTGNANPGGYNIPGNTTNDQSSGNYNIPR